MATEKTTANPEQGKSLIVQETFAQLLARVDKARDYRTRNLSGTSDGQKRADFIAWSESTAEARGFLDCLMTLNLLSEVDEAAWYEYMNGERDVAPEGSAL